MFQLFAQTDYSELDTTTLDSYSSDPLATSAANEMLTGGVLIAAIIIGLVLSIILIASMWKIFQKAGRPGWNAVVPFYNSWVLFEISGKPGWWGLIGLLAAIPIIGIIPAIIALVLGVIAAIELAKRFGKDTGFVVMMVLLPFIAYPILGFGNAKYAAPAGGVGAAGTQPGTSGVPVAASTPAATPVDTTPTTPTAPEQRPPSSLVQ